MVRISPCTRSSSTPGMCLRNSPTLPSATSPNTSEATLLVMFIELRCSMMALALPSRSLETVKAVSFTMPSPLGFSALVSSKSCVTVAPGATDTRAVAGL
jgi:hypothetical protein